MEAVFRDCCGHGHSTTESVFWNTNGLSYPWDQFFFKFIIESQQFGNGYVIGTRGPAEQVITPSGNGTAPVDWSEGIGDGDTLDPESLYEEQLARRMGTYMPDGGTTTGPDADAGPETADASPGVSGQDAGDPGMVEPSEDGGCGCTAAQGGTGNLVAYLGMLLFFGYRRGRRQR